jgi:hypothetical protein
MKMVYNSRLVDTCIQVAGLTAGSMEAVQQGLLPLHTDEEY